MISIDGLNYYINNNEASIGKYEGSEGTALVDKNRKGVISVKAFVEYANHKYEVTTVGKYAFSSSPNIECVSLPYTIKSLLWASFSFMPLLKEVLIPDNNNIVYMDLHIFYDSTSISVFVIPINLISINIAAFENSGITDLFYCGSNKINGEIRTSQTIHTTSRYKYSTLLGKSVLKDYFCRVVKCTIKAGIKRTTDFKYLIVFVLTRA